MLEELSNLVNYKLTELDIDAIDYGYENTDSEIPYYFEYSFCGDEQLDFAIANESGTDTLMMLVFCPQNIIEPVKYILYLATGYEIRKNN